MNEIRYCFKVKDEILEKSQTIDFGVYGCFCNYISDPITWHVCYFDSGNSGQVVYFIDYSYFFN